MTKRESARLAIVASVVAALALLAVIADDLWGNDIFRPPTNGTYALVAAMMVLGAIAPWLAWTRRGRAVHVRFSVGAVVAGNLRIAAADVTSLAVASAARGRSIAVGRGRNTIFLEVERAEDAVRIVEALGVREPPLGEMLEPMPKRLLAFPQAVISLAGLAFAPFYYRAAIGSYRAVAGIDAQAVFGVGGVVAAALAMILLVVRCFARGHAVALARGAWDAHVALHRADRGENAALLAPAAEMGGLSRGDEEVSAWLARLDALPVEQHAYRGDALKKDVLWETLGDRGAAVEARMGAARVLRRRYGEEEGALIRVVEDPDVRLRVEAALEEQDDAERQLATLGPLFRAR